jgi:hypothetical protein
MNPSPALTVTPPPILVIWMGAPEGHGALDAMASLQGSSSVSSICAAPAGAASRASSKINGGDGLTKIFSC